MEFKSPSRAQAKSIKCPQCGAEPNESCRSFNKPTQTIRLRKSNHIERVNAYLNRLKST